MPLDELPVLWRTKLRSTLEGVDHTAQVDHCLANNLVGVGWGIDDLPDGAPLEAIMTFARNNGAVGWGATAASTIRRIGADAQIGDFVWTRDTYGRYLLCRIAGSYRYDNSPASRRVDVHQVRDVTWAPRPLNDLEVPGGVIRTFIGTGTSFSRIHDPGARLLTFYLWEQLHKRPLPKLDMDAAQVLATHLDPYDVEDLIYVWLQYERNYLVFPRSRMRDTPAYEWSMIHRDTRRRGIVQVKTGHTSVDLNALADAAESDTDTFAFATCGSYDGNRGRVSEVIDDALLLAFAAQHPDLLPGRVRTWFALAG